MFWTRTCKHQPSAKSCAMIRQVFPSCSYGFLRLTNPHHIGMSPLPMKTRGCECSSFPGFCDVDHWVTFLSLPMEWSMGAITSLLYPFFVCLGGPSIGLDHDRCQSVSHIQLPLKTSVYHCWILLHLADCIPKSVLVLAGNAVTPAWGENVSVWCGWCWWIT